MAQPGHRQHQKPALRAVVHGALRIDVEQRGQPAAAGGHQGQIGAGGDTVESGRIDRPDDEIASARNELGDPIVGLEPGIHRYAAETVEVGVEGDELWPVWVGAVDQPHTHAGGGGTVVEVTAQPEAGLGALRLGEDQRGTGRRDVVAQARLIQLAVQRDVKTLVQQTQSRCRAGLPGADDGDRAAI